MLEKIKDFSKKFNKQIIVAIVACLVFLLTGVFGVLSARIMNASVTKLMESADSDYFSNVFSINSESEISPPDEPYVGQIDIVGTIQGSSDVTGLFTEETGGYNHSLYMDFIDEMIEDENNKGILLYIDTPGGTVYHSDELYLKLMEYKEKTGRSIYSYFASQATSGGYYVAMASDMIIANRNCWTGSIGVIVSTYNYKDLLDKIGVDEVNIASGNNKTMLSPGSEITQGQLDIMQSLVDESYNQFVDIVSKGRNMPKDEVLEIADGRIYSANQAYKLGLVDAIDSFEELVSHMSDETGCDNYYKPVKKSSIYSFLYGISNIKKGTDSDIWAAMEMMKNDNNGVLMYYAK